jgi:hypothetical protein
MAKRVLPPLAVAFFLASRAWAAEPVQDGAALRTTSKLVPAALEKELTGDNSQRMALLQQAIEETPKDAAAHWQLGEVRVHRKWQTVSQAEQAARQDKLLAEYARRRDTAGKNADDQTALARWCRRNRLDEQQRVHWRSVLQAQPDNAEAIQALGLKPYRGMLATAAEIDQFRAQLRRVSEAADRWRPRVAAWLRALDESVGLMPNDFRQEVLKITEPCEMLGLERALWLEVGAHSDKKQDYRHMTLGVALTLTENPSPAASQGLVRTIVLSDSDNVRLAAADGLKGRPRDQYIPLLLSGLQSPLKADLQCGLTVAGDLITRYSILQEGELCIFSATQLNFPVRLEDICPDLRKTYASAGMRAYRFMGTVRAIEGVDAVERAAAISATVAKVNRAIAEHNGRITVALRQTTGQNLGDQPTAWWNWWSLDINESYDDVPPTKPIFIIYDGYLGYQPPLLTSISCFAPGTKVWTLTGGQAIEKVKVGDCVLAQDIESGELAYKPVLATTVRKPRPRIRVGLGNESIIATPSHPFWVLGQGWRLTKQLAVGDRLHTPTGAVIVDRLEKLPALPEPAGSTYNLVVADFNTYFVGDRGILVHDNMPRAPTAALLPGLVKH